MRILTLALIIIAVVAIADGGVRLYGAASIASGGIMIHTEGVDSRVPGTIRFDYDVLNPVLCTTTCDTKLIRHDTNEVIASQERIVVTGGSISGEIEAMSSLRRVPVQLEVSCETKPTRYCVADEQTASDVTIIEFSLDDEDAARRTELLASRTDIETRFQEELSMLTGLSRLGSPYETLAQDAEHALASHLNAIITYRSDIKAERYDREPPQPPAPLSEWQLEREAAANVSNMSATITPRLETLSRYRSLLGRDLSSFENLTDKYRSRAGTARTQLVLLTSIQEGVEHIENLRGGYFIDTAYEEANATIRALTAACTIHATGCPKPITLPDSLEGAANQSEAVCAAVRNYDPQALNQAYAESLNLTLENALDTYNVSALRNSSGFAAFERSAIENATRGISNLTPAERLAIEVRVNASFCSPSDFEPFDYELPRVAGESYVVTIVIPDAYGCSFGSCDVEAQSPVLFIHGHSFSDETEPTSNLETMSNLAFALEDHDYLYAGHLFPDSERASTINVPVSFTATYYLNTYVEEGVVRLEPFKTASIPDYADRLAEDVERAQQVSGQDKVVLVAHSMGGLVARSYLERYGSERVEKLITIATPHHGITDRTERVCPVLGASLECRDMTKGSSFLDDLDDARPNVPVHVIAGTGCGEGDGAVRLENALLTWADSTTIINGTCSGLRLLHSELIEPDRTPTIERIAQILDP